VMKHKNIEILIQKLLDREISPDEERLLHGHLTECQDCRQLYEEYLKTEQSLGNLIELFPGYDFNQRVMSRLALGRSFAWTKAVRAFAGAWVVSLLFLLFVPFTNKLSANLLTSAPALVRTVNKIGIIINSLGHTLLPFARISINPLYPAIGLVFSIILVYIFGKVVKKEVVCNS
jgi:anti-sigma factor RsiW